MRTPTAVGWIDILRRCGEADLDPRRAAARARPQLSESDLLDILTEQIKHLQRDLVRELERTIIEPQRDSVSRIAGLATYEGSQSPLQPTPEERLAYTALLSAQFRLGDGVIVTWGTATPEQHRTRIAWFDRHIEGCLRTQRQHAIAAELIERERVRCLNEVQHWKELIVAD